MLSNKFDYFIDLSKKAAKDVLSLSFAEHLDEIDELRSIRDKFCIPITKDNVPITFMNGNSLGLMPKDVRPAILDQLNKWEMRGALGHTEEPMPWVSCDEEVLEDMSELVGSKASEIAIMNQLTVNLHLMLVAFYKPKEGRYKILCEQRPFPSDYYAFESQIEWHGYDPKEGILGISPRENEKILRTDDIVALINEKGHEIALICLSGVQFLTGQFFDIKRITEAGQKMGCVVGWDLAHAVGNVPLSLHEWNVDFAVWCSYKYLNSGAGSVGGVFVHEKNHNDKRTYFRGWWGHRMSDRFQMTNEFHAEVGALRYRLSNPSFICCTILKSSLKIFKEVGILNLRKKSILLTNYLEFLLRKITDQDFFRIITPEEVSERGSQLSLEVVGNLMNAKKFLDERSVLCDYREPGILRIAPCAMYNSFQEVFMVVEVLKDLGPCLNDSV